MVVAICDCGSVMLNHVSNGKSLAEKCQIDRDAG